MKLVYVPERAGGQERGTESNLKHFKSPHTCAHAHEGRIWKEREMAALVIGVIAVVVAVRVILEDRRQALRLEMLEVQIGEHEEDYMRGKPPRPVACPQTPRIAPRTDDLPRDSPHYPPNQLRPYQPPRKALD